MQCVCVCVCACMFPSLSIYTSIVTKNKNVTRIILLPTNDVSIGKTKRRCRHTEILGTDKNSFYVYECVLLNILVFIEDYNDLMNVRIIVLRQLKLQAKNA